VVSGRSDTQAGLGTHALGTPARPVPVPPGRSAESRSRAESRSAAESRSTAEPGPARSRSPRPASGGGRAAARPLSARPLGARRAGAALPDTRLPGTRLPGTRLPGTRRLPGTGLPAAEGSLRRAGRDAAARTSSRTPFIFLVVGLLGGGLLSLLIINTVLAAGSYQITALQKANAAQSQQVATLSQQVAADRSPAVIERRALQLGMVQPPLIKFLDLKTGRITSQPATDPGITAQPGWSP
jgi:hypothetical protein